MKRKTQGQRLTNHHQSASSTDSNANDPKKRLNVKDRFLAWILNRNKVVVILNITVVLCLCQPIILKTYINSTNKKSIKISPLLLNPPISTPYELDPPIPHILWFTYKENILNTKQPEHYYENVKNTIELYSKAFHDIADNNIHPSSKTQIYFMDDNDCLSHIARLVSVMKNDHPKMANLGNHFIAESNGSFKSDICRLAVLYLYGGYYFDVDMKVVKPFVAETFQRVSTDNRDTDELKRDPPKLKARTDDWETNELIREINEKASEINEKAKANYKYDGSFEVRDAYNITFVTVFNERRDTFFQSFLASIPRHPVISLNLLILADFYENGKKLKWKLPNDKTVVLREFSLVGPETLYLAYSHELGVDPIAIDDQLTSHGDIIVEDVIKVPKTTDSNNDILILNKEIRQQKNYLMSLLMASSKNFQKYLMDTSFILQETGLNQGVLPDLPRQSTRNINCNYIVHSVTRAQPLDILERNVYFYSRIPDSPNCPDETHLDSASSSVRGYLFKRGTCGSGTVGNGQCPIKRECCSVHGWCGYGQEYCGDNLAKVVAKEPLTLLPWLRGKYFGGSVGTCGQGEVGNDKCPGLGECCSTHGWCGKQDEFCFEVKS